MKDRILIDTWGWLAILNKREPRHAEVGAYYRAFRAHGGIAYTTDYILDETITLLFKRLPITIAKESLTHLETAVVEGYLVREWISPDRFENAVSLRFKLHDKPEISITDLTSMMVMRDLKIDTILTDDSHFVQVGMGFIKAPD
jgi:predicted nucleic acid-binding protein